MFCLGLQKLQCLFNDYYSLLCNFDCMGNPAPSRELLESNDNNLWPCGFICMLKYLVSVLLARSIAFLMDPFSTCNIFPFLGETLYNGHWDCVKDKGQRMCVGKGRLGEISFIVFLAFQSMKKKKNNNNPVFFLFFFPPREWNIKSLQIRSLGGYPKF